MRSAGGEVSRIVPRAGAVAWGRIGALGAMALAIAAASATPSPAQEQVNFGELEVFDLGSAFPETRYGWSSGDLLVTPLDFDARVGSISGSRNAQVTPPVKLFGKTIIPAVRADTRSGARWTTSLEGEAGVELFAGVTVGGDQFDAKLQAGPTLITPGPVAAGDFFSLQTDTVYGTQTTFDPGLPRLDAGMDVVLNGQWDNRFEYGLFPFAKYDVGEFGFDFDFDFNLLDVDIDLNLPKIPLPDVPEFPFDIPESERDNTLFRQKLPPKNPALNLAEIALDNPSASIETTSEVVDGKVRSFSKGSLLRTGLDLDGITSAAFTGVSFTGTSVKIGPGSIGYDLFDIKYGVELGIEYEEVLNESIKAELTFDKPVLVRNGDGTFDEVIRYSGEWDNLPEFALIGREDVNVDVDFTSLESILERSASLTLSDYMELQLIRANLGVLPGVNLFDLGPLYYQKFPLGGEFAAFPIFEDLAFALPELTLPEGLWDGSFTLEAAPIIDVYLADNAADLDEPADFIRFDTGAAATTLSDKTLVIGVDGSPNDPSDPASRLDVAAVDLVDPGNTKDVEVDVNYTGVVVIPSPLPFQPPREIPISNSIPATLELPDLERKTVLDGLVVPEGSSLTVAGGAVRQFQLNTVENDGLVVGEGFLGLEADAVQLAITGTGEIRFDSPGEVEAELLRHGEGHTLTFNAFGDEDLIAFDETLLDDVSAPEDVQDFQVTGVSAGNPTYDAFVNGTPFASKHRVDAQVFENAGTVAATGAELDMNVGTLSNEETGTLAVTDGGSLALRTAGTLSDRIENAGLLEAAGAGTTLEIGHGSLRGITGSNPGRIVARDGAELNFTGASFGSFDLRDQNVVAGEGSTVTFENFTRIFGSAHLVTEAGGTTVLAGGLVVKTLDDFEIVNRGTLEVLGDTSLIPDPDLVLGPGQEPPTIVPIDLVNAGTVNVRDTASFEFGVRIDNFNNDGATLAGGTWNVLGQAGDFSNLPPAGTLPDVATIRVEVLEVAGDDEYLFEVYEDLTQFDTALKTNAANVTLHGRALFPYFNTVETNRGNLTIAGGHRFTTAGSFTNLAGTTRVETGGDLFVQGALRVTGGGVTFDPTSTFTVGTETRTLDDGSTESRSVEVIGGTLAVADAGFLAATPMFADRASADPRFVRLNTGQTWVVREQVDIDPDTGDEIVTPGVIDLADAIIERSDGEIIIDGASASFDAAEAMQYNHGSLTLQNGFAFNTRLSDFRNADTMTLQGASFVVAGDAGTFRNDGRLFMDGESYLAVDHFINGGLPSGETDSVVFELDGVLDARRVTITANTSITGSGSVTGSILNDGLLDIGNSPGLVETFDDFTTSSVSTTRFEILGYEAGQSYDRLAVRQPTAEPGEPQPDPVVTTLAGTLELVFDPELSVRPNFTWLLMENEGEVVGGFETILTEGLDPATDPTAALALIRDTDDVLLGELDGLGLFFTATEGDGNDLAVYSIPEPGTLVMLVSLGLLYGRRLTR